MPGAAALGSMWPVRGVPAATCLPYAGKYQQRSAEQIE
jgi:hypothetical protein